MAIWRDAEGRWFDATGPVPWHFGDPAQEFYRGDPGDETQPTPYEFAKKLDQEIVEGEKEPGIEMSEEEFVRAWNSAPD